MSEINATTCNSIQELPLILALNSGGEPLGWINYEKSAFYYAKNKVRWSLGEYEVVLRGGINAETGKQSTLKMDTIIALDSNKSPTHYRKHTPTLSNLTLFERDMRLCAYCGEVFSSKKLTRDHVLPTSKGGKDIWTNVVTACSPCNRKKDARTPEQAGMPLLYVPYTPSYNETLILMNKKILSDQMEFLLKGVPENSRLHQMK
jgi:5-methylcytosine-specific restriction endonuclease McrA